MKYPRSSIKRYTMWVIMLGENEKYILKSIHPKHIVIQNKTDKSDFYVKLQKNNR